MARPEPGNIVRIHYTGRLTDGTVFDSSAEREPLEFTLGQGEVIPGFERAVLGMEHGEQQTVSIPCEEAYGVARQDLIFSVPRDQIPPEIDPAVGQRLQMHQGGRVGVVVVREVTEESVTLDANHPLAGQDLIFDLQLVGIG